MKIVKKSQSQEFKNGSNCAVYEYPMGDNAINGAVVKLKGRYPDKGSSVNTVCKLMAYIVDGGGAIFVDGKKQKSRKATWSLSNRTKNITGKAKWNCLCPALRPGPLEQYKVIE